MDSQETCDRMKQLCLDNGLAIWESLNGWDINIADSFCYSNSSDFNGDFAIYKLTYGKTQVTETEFIELLKTTK